MAGLRQLAGLWLSALPIHDANGYVEEDSTLAVAPAQADAVHFGVIAIDPFRAPDALFRRLHARGIRRIVNLPSISFFDGRTAEVRRPSTWARRKSGLSSGAPAKQAAGGALHAVYRRPRRRRARELRLRPLP